MFFRASLRLYVTPRLPTVTCFRALGSGFTFSHVWRLITCFWFQFCLVITPMSVVMIVSEITLIFSFTKITSILYQFKRRRLIFSIGSCNLNEQPRCQLTRGKLPRCSTNRRTLEEGANNRCERSVLQVRNC